MTFDQIIGHDRQKEFLRRTLAHNRLAHAYLFEGPQGVGKRLTALALARTVFCAEATGCGDCIPCRKIDHNNHPDLHILEPDGKQIKIEQIRNLQKTLAFKPVESTRRICLIDQADKMNPAAANSLLKTLEEPSAETLILLISARPEALLTTVLSRCQRLPFARLPQSCIESTLIEQRGYDQKEAHIIAALADGSFQMALDRDPTIYLERRIEILKQVTALSAGSILPLMELAKELSTEKETIPQTLELLQAFYRDLLLYRHNRPLESLINIDLQEKIRRIAAREDNGSILNKLDALNECQRNHERNVNPQLNLEVLLLRLAA
ncbi:MAG: DNA polymerase III subunit delta' [Desulfuromonadales bacterium]|nr:DNA polymerase III subunit delta' [Desulfuromonadales bacterium]